MKYLTSIDLNQNELLKGVFENYTGAPTALAGKEGQVIYDSTGDRVYICTTTGIAGGTGNGAGGTAIWTALLKSGEAGSGTVTSVTGETNVVDVATGTTTPAITLHTAYGDTKNPYASKTANYFLAAPNGAAGVPSFRAVVAADIPTLNQNTTGTAANVTGTVAIANGGTGQTAKTAAFNALSPLSTLGDILIHNGTDNIRLAGNTTAVKQVLVQTGTGAVSAAPTWSTLTASDVGAQPSGSYVTTFSAGTTGLTPSTGTSGAVTLAGTLGATNGGTGQSTYAVGDLLVGGATNTLSKLADVAVGSVLVSGGVGVAPSWATALPSSITATTQSAGDNSTKVATTAYVDAIVAAADAMVFKGTVGAGGTYEIAAFNSLVIYNAGWTYKVITAGTIKGVACEVGDMLISTVDRASGGVNGDWVVIQTNIDGAVTGPASATTTNFASFNGTSGKIIQDSGVGAASFATAAHQTHYIGKTQVQSTSASQAVTGLLSATFDGSASGTVQLIPTAAAGTGTVLTMPATTGTLALTSQIPTVNAGTLGASGVTAGATNTSVAINFSAAWNANSASNVTINPVVGPAIADYVGKLTGGSLGFLQKTAQDVITLNTAVTQKYSTTLSTSATSYVVTHNLNSQDCSVTVREALNTNTNPDYFFYKEVFCDVEFTSANTVTLRFAVAPAANTYRVTVIG